MITIGCPDCHATFDTRKGAGDTTTCPACETSFAIVSDENDIVRTEAKVIEPEDAEDMVDFAIYLAGPVQNFDSHDWRQDIKRDFEEFEFIDPMDWSEIPGVPTNVDGVPTEEANITPQEVRTKCEQDLEKADALFAFKPEDVRSDGTAMECRMADAEHDIPVAVCTTGEDTIGSFLGAHVDFEGYTFEDCFDWLELRA